MPLDHKDLAELPHGNRSLAIARSLEDDIGAGRLGANERLPAVRALSQRLGVSGGTVVAAYAELQRRGLVRAEVGRGTFVHPTAGSSASPPGIGRSSPPSNWRRAEQTARMHRLAAAHPRAADAASGTPDPALLPTDLLQAAWQAEIGHLSGVDLQYGDATLTPELTETVQRWLESDTTPVRDAQLVTGSSVMQLLDLALECLITEPATQAVAVEEPGYPNVLDLLDRRGIRAIPCAVDAHGVQPESLAAALDEGASAAVLTPRAHNPTGASWSAERVSGLAAVLAEHPEVTVLEDDHAAALVPSNPASLRSDSRVRDQVVHLRSLSKVIGPDLRMTIALVPERLYGPLLDRKRRGDGWSPRLTQRVVARVLGDDRMPAFIDTVRGRYGLRREYFAAGLRETGLTDVGGHIHLPSEGLNLWITLPPQLDAAYVVNRAAEDGLLIQSSEAYFLHRNNNAHLRVTTSRIEEAAAHDLGRTLGSIISEGPDPRTPRLPAV